MILLQKLSVNGDLNCVLTQSYHMTPEDPEYSSEVIWIFYYAFMSFVKIESFSLHSCVTRAFFKFLQIASHTALF